MATSSSGHKCSSQATKKPTEDDAPKSSFKERLGSLGKAFVKGSTKRTYTERGSQDDDRTPRPSDKDSDGHSKKRNTLEDRSSSPLNRRTSKMPKTSSEALSSKPTKASGSSNPKPHWTKDEMASLAAAFINGTSLEKACPGRSSKAIAHQIARAKAAKTLFQDAKGNWTYCGDVDMRKWVEWTVKEDYILAEDWVNWKKPEETAAKLTNRTAKHVVLRTQRLKDEGAPKEEDIDGVPTRSHTCPQPGADQETDGSENDDVDDSASKEPEPLDSVLVDHIRKHVQHAKYLRDQLAEEKRKNARLEEQNLELEVYIHYVEGRIN